VSKLESECCKADQTHLAMEQELRKAEKDAHILGVRMRNAELLANLNQLTSAFSSTYENPDDPLAKEMARRRTATHVAESTNRNDINHRDNGLPMWSKAEHVDGGAAITAALGDEDESEDALALIR